MMLLTSSAIFTYEGEKRINAKLAKKYFLRNRTEFFLRSKLFRTKVKPKVIKSQFNSSHHASAFSKSISTEPDILHNTSFFPPLIRFSRPHTMIGTMVSILSVVWMTVEDTKFIPLSLKIFQALIPSLLINVSIVGLNQLYDRRIDKINKPYLPLATGDISADFALCAVSICMNIGLFCGIITNSVPMMVTLVMSLLLGVFYSVDVQGLRWKRSPILATACIIGVRSIIVQLGFFFYAAEGFAVEIPTKIHFAIIYMLFYSIIISILKDIPDFIGDKERNIRTLTVIKGPSNTFKFCTQLLIALYLSGASSCIFCSSLFRTIFVFSAHIVCAILILYKKKSVFIESSTSLHQFYMFMWKV
jgi:homogentisate phytyltransferase/homogentisate geranylgeranyltransferase